MALVSAHTQSQMIREVSARGWWSGHRRGIQIRLTLDRQIDTEGNRIAWRAYIIGDYRGTRKSGRAGTVVDALRQIEQGIRKKP